MLKYTLLITLMLQNQANVTSLSYELSPSYINTGEGFLQVCTFTSNPVLSRGTGDVCMIDCIVLGCNLEQRADINCSPTWIQVNISTAEEEDFGLWRCSGDGTYIERCLSEYVAVNLTYIDFEPDIIEGDQYSFICQATDGVPGSVIRWEINGNPVDDSVEQENNTDTQTSNLTITADRSFSTLQCVADQVPNKDPIYGGEKTLNVLYPPTNASTETPKQIVIVGDTAHFECWVDGHGNPQEYDFIWTRAGDTGFKQDTDNGVLELAVASVEFEDTYYCTPENVAGQGQPAEMLLTVNSPPKLVDPPISPHTKFCNDSLVLDCVVEGKPGFTKIHWIIPESAADIYKSTNHSIEVNGTLTIHTVRLEWNTADNEIRKTGNQVEVTCFADNGIEGTLVEHLVVLNIQYESSKAAIDLNNTEIDVEGTVEFSCNHDASDPGNPLATEYVFRNTNDWSGNSKDSYQLPINSVTQEADYTCAGINYPQAYPEGLEGSLSDPTHLQVLVPPNMLNPPDDIDNKPVYNQEYSLSCEATGKPNVSISWEKNNNPVSDNEFKPQTDTPVSITGPYDLQFGINSSLPWIPQGSEATCETVTKYDGAYRCVASNIGPRGEERENRSSVIKLITQFPPIWHGSNMTNAELNKSVTVNCSICAEPMPGDTSYKWYKDGEILTKETGKQVLIHFVTKDNIGLYTCECNNGIGSSRNYTINVTETGPPIIQDLKVLSNRTSTVAPLSWTIVTDGGYEPLSFIVYMMIENSDNEDYVVANDSIPQYVKEGDPMYFDVVGLEPDTSYSFKVRAKNNRPNDAFSTNITESGNTIASPNIEITHVEVEDSSMTVQWKFNPDKFSAQRSTTAEYEVKLCIKYEDENNKVVEYPENRNCSIPVEPNKYVIEGEFDRKSSYQVSLIIHENGYNGANAWDRYFESAADPTLGGGGVAAIVVVSLLIISIVVVGLLVHFRKIPINLGLRSNPPESSEFGHLTGPGEIHGDGTSVVSNEYKDENMGHGVTKQNLVSAIDSHVFTDDEPPVIYADLDQTQFPGKSSCPVLEDKVIEEKDLVYADLQMHHQQPNSGEVTERKPEKKKVRTAVVKSVPAAMKATQLSVDRISELKQVLNVDEAFKMKASYGGTTPHSVLTWKYNDEVVLTNDVTSGTMINNTRNTSELVVKNALKEQSGKYTFSVTDENGFAEVTFYIVIIGRLIHSLPTDDGVIHIPIPPMDDDDDDNFEVYGQLPQRLLN